MFLKSTQQEPNVIISKFSFFQLIVVGINFIREVQGEVLLFFIRSITLIFLLEEGVALISFSTSSGGHLVSRSGLFFPSSCVLGLIWSWICVFWSDSLRFVSFFWTFMWLKFVSSKTNVYVFVLFVLRFSIWFVKLFVSFFLNVYVICLFVLRFSIWFVWFVVFEKFGEEKSAY